MKRTMLALTLLVLFTSASVGFGASPDDADLRLPTPARSLSSTAQGDQINLQNSLTSNSNGVIPYIEDPPSVNVGNSILYTVLGLLDFGA